MMRCLWDFSERCLRASCANHQVSNAINPVQYLSEEMMESFEHTPATCMLELRWAVPWIFVRCRPARIPPKSEVNVERTSGPFPPMLIRPTAD